MAEYVELHSHSNFSFQEGASTIEEMIGHAVELGYPALGLTDHDNLCGAMRFARKAKRVDLQPIIGAEITLAANVEPGLGQSFHPHPLPSRERGIKKAAAQQHTAHAELVEGPRSHLTLLAATSAGYKNLSNLLSLSPMGSDRRDPRLDPSLLPERAEGIIALSGCAHGAIPQALDAGRWDEARTLARQYLEWFGDRFYIELQQNLVHGDTSRMKALVSLGRELGIPLVASNNAHYHIRDRHRLQDCLVAASHRKTLEESHRERRANAEYYLKPAEQMAWLFREVPEAVENTLAIAERCSFNPTIDLTYRFPEYPVPGGKSQADYLEELCRCVAKRRHGGSIPAEIDERLREEMRRIERHNLAGLLLMYHEIIGIAREVQIDLGLIDPEVPIEAAPPGRGRGSSVAMLVGYLLGLSHIDPMKYDLGLDRFLPEDLVSAPDIDLDFPRNIREELIIRVHKRYGWEHAALTGAFPTYKIRGAIRDMGLALGLPDDQLDKLAKQTEHANAGQLHDEMLAMPDFRDKADAPVWRDLIDLAGQLAGFPRGLSQHPGGMVLSSTPLMDSVPVHQAAMDGRYIVQWDKHSVEDARMVKIDFLAIGALSQMQQATALIEERSGERIDLSRIEFEDENVYAMMHRADTIGIFQIESAAQIQTITRIKPRNLVDMAFEVAAVRPGVGANDGVSEFIRRRVSGTTHYDHEREIPALQRTLGVILFQDQFNELAVHVAGFTSTEAEEFRRAHGRADEQDDLLAYWWPKFRDGAAERGVDGSTAARIFQKFNGHYMFPESHAYAFGVTAYQMSWLKYYYPLEFYVGLFTEQPMGFYNLETLKEDAKRHDIRVLNPDVNLSGTQPRIYDESLLLGLLSVESVGATVAERIVAERDANGDFRSITDLMTRTGIRQEALDNLTDAGALDSLAVIPRKDVFRQAQDEQAEEGRDSSRSFQGRTRVGMTDRSSRRDTRWEVGLRYRPVGKQLSLEMPIEQDMVDLTPPTDWEVMEAEYRTMGIHPSSHMMAYLRADLPHITTSADVWQKPDGTAVQVAGLVVRRQHPQAKTYFLTLEDEFGHTPALAWPDTYKQYRNVIREPALIIHGTVSRREGTMNILVRHVEPLSGIGRATPRSKDWG
jgi:error-prone DNA polymerase